jgi:hypothetical protein
MTISRLLGATMVTGALAAGGAVAGISGAAASPGTTSTAASSSTSSAPTTSTPSTPTRAQQPEPPTSSRDQPGWPASCGPSAARSHQRALLSGGASVWWRQAFVLHPVNVRPGPPTGVIDWADRAEQGC